VLLIKGLEKFPNSAELYSNIGVTLINSGSEKAGVGHFHTYWSKAKKMENIGQSVYNNLGAYYLRNKKYKLALDELKNADKFEPKNATLLVNMGLCYYHLGKLAQAKKFLNQALEVSPSNLTAKELLAKIYDEQEDYETAEEYYSDLISQSDEKEKYTFILGDILIKMGDTERGIGLFEDMARDNPEKTEYLISLVERYLKIEYYDIAILKLEKLLQRFPKHLKACSFLGESYYHQGVKNPLRINESMDKSLFYFKKVLNENPDHIKSNYYAGLIYLNQKNDRNMAIDYWNKIKHIKNLPSEMKEDIESRIR
jgi:tetratricopeptide (TPR) repeat protein